MEKSLAPFRRVMGELDERLADAMEALARIVQFSDNSSLSNRNWSSMPKNSKISSSLSFDRDVADGVL